MSNYRRAYLPGGTYFFTVVTFNRVPIFTDENRVEALRQAFRKVKATRPFEIDAMVIMPEHAIRDEEDWRRHVDYIHYNPVKHGLASSPGEWAWSSFDHAVSKGWYEQTWGEREPATIVGMDCE